VLNVKARPVPMGSKTGRKPGGAAAA
jgi:hypothetical protein